MSENTKAGTFSLVDEHARMGKIGNNLERHGDTDEMLGWTLPITAMLPADQIDALKGEYFHRSLYNINKNPWEVVEGFKDCAPLEDERTFEGVKAFLGFTVAKRELEFEGCRVTRIFYEAQLGGLTKTWFHLYVHPEIGEETSLLLEHQNGEVSISLADGKVALKKNPKQQSLPLDQPKEGTQTSSAPTTVESDAQSQDGQSEASDQVVDPNAHPDPDATNDAGETSSNPAGPGETVTDPAEDLARFEAGATQAAAEFKQLAEGGVIDGRSERVRHLDAQRSRRRNGAA